MKRFLVAISCGIVTALAIGTPAFADRTVPVFSVTQLVPNVEFSGPINSVAVSPLGESRVLVASETGGVFRSDDAGNHWSHEDSLPNARVQSLAFVGPVTPQRVLATAMSGFEVAPGSGGIYARTGEGGSWIKVPNESVFVTRGCNRYPAAYEISVAPDTAKVYVATDCGVAISDPAAVSFTPTDVPDASPPNFRSVVALANGHVIVGGPGGVWFSRDDGRTWSRERTGIGMIVDLHGLGRDPRGGDRAYAVVLNRVDGNGVALFDLVLTTDGGQTWAPTSAPAGSGACGGIGHVKGTLSGGRVRIYFGNTCDTKVASFAASVDATAPGVSWTALVAGHADTRDLAFRRDSPQPYLSASDGGIYRNSAPRYDATRPYADAADRAPYTSTGGPMRGLDADQVTEVVVQYIGGSPVPFVYFATWHNGIWSMKGSALSAPLCCEGFGFGVTRRAAYDAAAGLVTVMHCFRCGNTKTNVWLVNPRDFVTSKAGIGVPTLVSPGRYVEYTDDRNGFSPGLVYSDHDDGGPWRQIASFRYAPRGLPKVAGPESSPTLIQPVNVGPLEWPNLWAQPRGSEQVHPLLISGFTAASGIAMPTPPAMRGFGSLGVVPTNTAWYEVLAVDPLDPLHIVAPDVFSLSVKATTDGGGMWSVDPGLGALSRMVTHDGRLDFSRDVGINRFTPLISTISMCPDRPSRMLAGTWQGGAYFSPDRGATWLSVPQSNAIAPATSIAWLDGCSGAYVSTYGRGIWQIDVGFRTEREPPPQHPCDPPICRLLEIIKQVLLKPPIPGPSPVKSLFVFDGRITQVVTSGKTIQVYVSPNSIPVFYPSQPQNVTVTVKTEPASGAVLQGLLFRPDGSFEQRLGAAELDAAPPVQHAVVSGPERSPPDALPVVRIDGNEMPMGYALVDDGQLRVRVVRGSASDARRLVLRVDRQPVAEFAANAERFDYAGKVPDANPLQNRSPFGYGAHLVDVVVKDSGAVLATNAFIVTHHDAFDEKPVPAPPQVPQPVHTPQAIQRVQSAPIVKQLRVAADCSGGLPRILVTAVLSNANVAALSAEYRATGQTQVAQVTLTLGQNGEFDGVIVPSLPQDVKAKQFVAASFLVSVSGDAKDGAKIAGPVQSVLVRPCK